MPLCSSSNCSRERHRETNSLGVLPSPGQAERSSRCVTIGLINNMPDAALEATERQFRSLLGSASDGVTVRLSLYSLPGVPRTEAGKRHMSSSYMSTESLWETQLDGLIVTGAEPRMANLKDEPYWESFTTVLEWAKKNTLSTVFSCLAAHAAVLHMDGIGRVKSDQKHSGIFDCSRLIEHPLLAGAPANLKHPHSRWNGLSEAELTASGYTVLTQSHDTGVDTFFKRQRSLFVFLQGHPEYEADTLLREYRRDVGRYLRRETHAYPEVPQNYFDKNTTNALEALREQAISGRSEELLTYVSTTLEHGIVENTWRSTAVSLYSNWLQYIREQKESRRHLTRISLAASAPELLAAPLRQEIYQIDSAR